MRAHEYAKPQQSTDCSNARKMTSSVAAIQTKENFAMNQTQTLITIATKDSFISNWHSEDQIQTVTEIPLNESIINLSNAPDCVMSRSDNKNISNKVKTKQKNFQF